MYKLDLPVDYKEASAIERRRNVEEQRKSRIFNARVRTIGVRMSSLQFSYKMACALGNSHVYFARVFFHITLIKTTLHILVTVNSIFETIICVLRLRQVFLLFVFKISPRTDGSEQTKLNILSESLYLCYLGNWSQDNPISKVTLIIRMK